MAGTNIIVCRSALITALEGLQATTLAGVNVSYSYVAKKADLGSREYIYGGPKSSASDEPAAMRGSGRVKREENPDWTLHIRVVKPGEETTLASDTRAVAILTVVENYLAANHTLNGLTGLLKAVITGWELTSWADEKQTYSEIDLALMFESYLT
jgi:hypothetical protein